jgi:hypothetical protein
MSAKSKDTLFIAIGGLAFIGTSIWAVLQQSTVTRLEASFDVPKQGREYLSSALKITPPESLQWADAPKQTAGENWRFEVFTPPQIFYNSETKQFTVIPPVRAVKGPVVVAEVIKPLFGLELVKVEQPLFRLQLVGALGEGPNARGTFENQLTKEIIIGTKGKKIDSLGLEIISFVSQRKRISVKGGSDLIEDVVVATVKDTQTGVETQLDAKVRKTEGPVTCTVKNSQGEEKVLRQGELFSDDTASYELLEITLMPPAVKVKKTLKVDKKEEITTLTIGQPSATTAAPTTAAPSNTAPTAPTTFPF